MEGEGVVGCWPLERLEGLGLGIGGGWGACGGWRGTKAGLCGEEEAGTVCWGIGWVG